MSGGWPGRILARLIRIAERIAELGPNLGMPYTRAMGDTAFTVPLFDEFMKQIMPGDSWRNESA